MAFPVVPLGAIAGIRGCPLCATLIVDRWPSPSPAGVPLSGLAAPMTWPLAGICSPTHGGQVHGARKILGSPWRVQIGRSGKGHTHWFSWVTKTLQCFMYSRGGPMGSGNLASLQGSA